MTTTIAILPGDGIGPEIVAEDVVNRQPLIIQNHNFLFEKRGFFFLEN